MEAKCEVEFPLERRDVEMVDRLGIQGFSLMSTCVRRGRRVKKKVQRMGSWHFEDQY